ncbi:phosphoribosyltransferase family protein [Orbaceae bacterium ac157xtp]
MLCILCHLPLKLNWGICSQCASHFPYLPSTCPVCGLPLSDLKQPCHFCKKLQFKWDNLIAVADYKPPFPKLIQQFKSYNKVEYGYAFSRLLFINWYYQRLQNKVFKPDLITCIPLHHHRYWQRGYNQSELLAKPLAKWIKCDYQPYLLSRTVNRSDQKMLSKTLRQTNISHAFDCQKELTGKTIAIVDDVITTGSTMNEACRLLKLCGATKIQVLCLCRTSL